MPPLAARLFRRRNARPRAPLTPEAWRHRRDLRWHWSFVVIGLVLMIAAYCWYVSASLLEQPIELSFGPDNPSFPAAMGPLLGAEFTGGNDVQLLLNGDGFFPPMLDAIRHAEHTILLETYIWAPGKISDQFIAALSERAQAGVKVHVLLDGMGTLKFHGADRDRLRDSGVEVLTYGRQHWYEIKPNINHRTHRKILVVDGRIGFTGGMCVDDRWLGDGHTPDHWRETQVRVEGPAVQQMTAVFAANWMQTCGQLLLGPGYFPRLESAGHLPALCFKSGPGEGAEAARISYLLAIAAARKTIDIEHAYFVPDDLAIRMLLDARRRGVRIRVIVPEKNDSRFGRAASRSRWGELIAHGVEFYRYEPALLHAKVMSVDDTFVTVGSVNFDNRSFSINDEVALNVLDPGFAREFRRSFEDDLRRSRRYTPEEFDSRPAWQKLVDQACGLFRSQL